MKVKEELSLEILLNYGFEKIDKKEEEDNEEYTISSYDYKFEIGHARRGQFYYLLASEKPRSIIIYASEPDGGGGIVNCPDVLIRLVEDGVVSPNGL
jgi:hypothetical protein